MCSLCGVVGCYELRHGGSKNKKKITILFQSLFSVNYPHFLHGSTTIRAAYLFV